MKQFWLIPETAVSPKAIADLAVCISDNEGCKPLEGIHINEKHAVASNNHNMRLLEMSSENKVSKGLSVTFKPSRELIEALDTYNAPIQVDVFENNIFFNFGNIVVEAELNHAIYPPYNTVMQKADKYDKIISTHTGGLKNLIHLDTTSDRPPDAAVMPIKSEVKVEIPSDAVEKVTKGFTGELVIGIRDHLTPIHIWMIIDEFY